MNLKLINEPELFQGRNKKRRYFEGWYFKQVSKDLKSSISIIPGISINSNDKHAFIQTITNINTDSVNRVETHYHKFLIDDFKYNDEPFSLEIGDNKFSLSKVELRLTDIHGTVNFSDLTKIKVSKVFPNSMGYFAYLPIMECFHGIISMSHDLSGTLTLNEETIDFCNGKGYIEKDWGTSFPKEYIWIQSNNFSDSDASIMCSIANIPFFGASFQGFICNLTFGGKEYRFASYNHSKLTKVNDSKDVLNIAMVNSKFKLLLSAKMDVSGTLKSPKNGAMNNVIKEALNGTVDVRLINESGEIVFAGIGNPCGIENFKDSK
ncbi:MAG: tocopherol cyclase family protein [Bacillota bacterium]|nr:tocopherol cyclase family protein [Bacillota bacterium]